MVNFNKNRMSLVMLKQARRSSYVSSQMTLRVPPGLNSLTPTLYENSMIIVFISHSQKEKLKGPGQLCI